MEKFVFDKFLETLLRKPRRAIPAGALMQKQITFQFAIYYLSAPVKSPVEALDKLLKENLFRFRRVGKVVSTGKPLMSAQVVSNARKSYAPPSIKSLQYFGRGLSQQQAEALQNSEQALILTFSLPKEQLWRGMRAATQLASSLAHEAGGLLWDEEARLVFAPDAWDKQRINDWAEQVPDISDHIVVHLYKKRDYVRAISLGMAKFGLPDIIINDFPWSLNDNMVNIISLFGQATAEGATIEKAGEFDLDIRAIKNSQLRERQVTSLKPNATAKTLLLLREGTQEAGDPNNRLIEITFERYPGSNIHEKQVKMLSDLFGWEDSLSYANHDDVLLSASRRAREELPALRAAFNTGLTPGEFIQIKASFKTPDENTEWMWVELDFIHFVDKNEEAE